MKTTHDCTTDLRAELNTDRYVKGGMFPRSFYAGIKQETKKTGGFTYIRPDRDRKLAPYVIANGVEKIELTRKEFYSGVDLESFLNARISLWLRAWQYDGFGTWINPDTNKVEIAPVSLNHFLDNAIRLAQDRNESAIWDRHEHKIITVTGSVQ